MKSWQPCNHLTSYLHIAARNSSELCTRMCGYEQPRGFPIVFAELQINFISRQLCVYTHKLSMLADKNNITIHGLIHYSLIRLSIYCNINWVSGGSAAGVIFTLYLVILNLFVSVFFADSI